MKLGFIGFGEASSWLAEGLRQKGLTEILAYDKFWNVSHRSHTVCERASKAGVRLAPSLEEVCTADIIMCAVSAEAAVPIAMEAKPYLSAGQIYADLNATSPRTKRHVGGIISPVALFVDAAVMAPIPGHGHKVPILVAGTGAKDFCDQMRPFGMNLTIKDGPAGSAAAVKMARSIFMKGFVALLIETVVTGHRYGVEDEVLASIEETLTSAPFRQVINTLLSRAVVHSERREQEMREVIDELDALGINSIMATATKAKLHWWTRQGLKQVFGGVPPADFHEILTELDRPTALRGRS